LHAEKRTQEEKSLLFACFQKATVLSVDIEE